MLPSCTILSMHYFQSLHHIDAVDVSSDRRMEEETTVKPYPQHNHIHNPASKNREKQIIMLHWAVSV